MFLKNLDILLTKLDQYKLKDGTIDDLNAILQCFENVLSFSESDRFIKDLSAKLMAKSKNKKEIGSFEKYSQLRSYQLIFHPDKNQYKNEQEKLLFEEISKKINLVLNIIGGQIPLAKALIRHSSTVFCGTELTDLYQAIWQGNFKAVKNFFVSYPNENINKLRERDTTTLLEIAINGMNWFYCSAKSKKEQNSFEFKKYYSLIEFMLQEGLSTLILGIDGKTKMSPTDKMQQTNIPNSWKKKFITLICTESNNNTDELSTAGP